MLLDPYELTLIKFENRYLYLIVSLGFNTCLFLNAELCLILFSKNGFVKRDLVEQYTR